MRPTEISRHCYDAGGCEFGSRREMMKSSTTTTNARIPHKSTPPWLGI